MGVHLDVILIVFLFSLLGFAVPGWPRSAVTGQDLSMWIGEKQVKMFSGYNMEIYVISNGTVMPYILDPDFERHLPTIPAEVSYVNFTWMSRRRRYYYNFDRLLTFNDHILHRPVISIDSSGRIPRKPKMFSVFLPCSGNTSGIASFAIGLNIVSKKGKPFPGTPLRLRLKKECSQRGPDPECDKKCANGGHCNESKICQCPEGYMGQHCNMALCYPQCANGGTCTSPGVCSCPIGYQGTHCEGGICERKCLNGGKCVQKDTCKCPRGYYGPRCELTKCVIPCLNGGRCKGVNKCRCPLGFHGRHCEVSTRIISPRHANCSRPCRHGRCAESNKCHCQEGWYGRKCNRRLTKRHKGSRPNCEDNSNPTCGRRRSRNKQQVYVR